MRLGAGRGKIVAMASSPTNPQALLAALRTENPTAPRLTWYGADSERVELSGRVLENWVAKTANYLVDELDAEPGTTIALDVPVHWRSLVWLLASWAVGATVTIAPDDGGRADIYATTDPVGSASRIGGNPLIVAVALPALAMRWMGELPAGVLDYAGEVRAHGDVFFADQEPDPSNIAWRCGSVERSYAELLGAVEPSPADRVLLEGAQGWAAVVPLILQSWATGGSVVLLDPSVEATAQLRAMEKVTRG